MRAHSMQAMSTDATGERKKKKENPQTPEPQPLHVQFAFGSNIQSAVLPR